MADLIDRAAAIDRIDKCVALSGIGCEPVMAIRDVKALISVLPAVDAVPVVHGRWRELKDGTEECTNCHGLCPHEENYNGDVIFNFGCEYCPWCGARMDGERMDENGSAD